MAVKDKELKRIVEGCKKGNPGDQKELYHRFASYMLSICNRYARNIMDAEDIFQEGFLKVYANIHQLKRVEAVMWWMKRIFVNEALSFYQKQPDLYRLDNIPEEKGDLTEEETPVSKISTEEMTLMIQNLPNKMRMVFNMYVIEGYTHQEISDLLGISVGTSKSNLHDARKILQMKIRQFEYQKNTDNNI